MSSMDNMDNMLIALVANQYVQALIEKVRQQIIEKGLHRWTLKKYEFNYATPDPSILKLRMLIQKLLFAGADKLETTGVQYDSQTSSLQVEICVPQLQLKSGQSSIVLTFLEKNFDGKLSGRIDIKNLRISCKTRVAVSEGSGITTENWDVKVTVESITSNVRCSILEKDVSDIINNYLRDKLPELINLHGSKVAEVLEIIFKNIPQTRGTHEIDNMF